MKITERLNMHRFSLLLVTFLLSTVPVIYGQTKYMVDIPVTQQDSRIHVTLMYQEKNDAFGMMTQDYRITVTNNTTDKLKVYIDYGARLVCGAEKSHKLGPLGDGITIAPSQTVGKPYGSDGIGSAVRLTAGACPRESWKQMGEDEKGSALYSMISTVYYRIVKIENISEKERSAAEAKKQKAEAELRKKAEAEQKQKAAAEERERLQRENTTKTAQNTTVSERTAMSTAGSLGSSNAPAANLSEKVKVNGEYVQVYRENGVPYVRRADGSTHQTTETAFNQISKISNAAKSTSSIAQQQELHQQRIAAQQAEYQRKAAADKLYAQQRDEIITQGVSEMANLISGIMQYNRAEKERQQAIAERRAEAERQRQHELYMMQTNRRDAFAILPATDIPLVSKEKASNLYFFIYAHNDLSSEYGASAYVSNVFEVGKYRDGTRAYTAKVKNEIENLTPYSEVLHGYYYTYDEAANTRNNLIRALKSTGMRVEEVQYKGKPGQHSPEEIKGAPQPTFGTVISDENTQSVAVPEEKVKKQVEKSNYGTLIK